MGKKIVIFSLIVSVVSLIYMLLLYFGYIRYYKLHVVSTENYINLYPKLDRADKGRVVVSFNATNEQLARIKPFINSILDQTVMVDDIALNVEYKNMGKVPVNLKKILSVYGFTKDYGAANCLIPCILREPEATTKIVVLDPEMVYGKDFIEQMINASNRNPTNVIYAKGTDIKQGILVKPSFFTESVCSYESKDGCVDWLNRCTKATSKSINYKETFRRLA